MISASFARPENSRKERKDRIEDPSISVIFAFFVANLPGLSRMPAAQAFLPVHAERRAAAGAGPLLLFPRDECPDAERPDRLEVREHAHAVLRPVAVVQLPQAAAREGRAVAAEAIGLALLRAVAQAALPAVGRARRALQVVAARTPVLFPQMSDAQRAIHPARRDHPRLDGAHGKAGFRTGVFHGARRLGFFGLGAGRSRAVIRINSEIHSRSSKASSIRKKFFAPG